jgi:imidazolonepropionase-like amidohydrolase
MTATNAAINDLAKKSFRVDPIASAQAVRHLALTGATLIDGNGGTPVRNAVVIVQNGQITAAGPAVSTPIPTGARQLDMAGKTIIPGLWDSHAHLNQADYGPAYLAAGVTTVRDMGNEMMWVYWLRAHTRFGRALGPSMILAGLVDGPGPNAFGAQSASTPAEGRAIVKRYSELGFDEIKLYNLLAPDVVAAIVDEAHKNQMLVTGHIPNALGLRNAVSAGMDHIAHLSGTLVSDSGASLIAHLVAKKTVMDPMVSWNEIGGHSRDEPLESFQPGAKYMPAAFMQTRAAGWGAQVDTATAHARLGASLSAIRALHKAGVPIVAGTDMGVPGFSIYRELELYVKAGMTPMEAIRSATAVAARAMNMDRTVGTIAPGRKADLVVLDADPLQDISNIRAVRYVMKDGRVYESAALWGMVGVMVPR